MLPLVAYGQTTQTAETAVRKERLSFEVASVKRFDLAKGAAGHTDVSSTRIRLMSNLEFFLETAYGVEESQILGAPGWARNEFYEIIAKMPEPSTPAQTNEMLRTLLEDRFKLTAHTEKKEQPVYSLLVAKGGLKMKVIDAGDSTGFNSGLTRLWGALSTSQIAYQLTSHVGRTVIDNTGLNGRYKVDLNWAPDDQAGAGDTANSPSIFTALREQLGLKLEPAKGKVEMLVIDHMDRPSEN